jgi:hypothetical protein
MEVARVEAAPEAQEAEPPGEEGLQTAGEVRAHFERDGQSGKFDHDWQWS